jgi:two-component system chemotaxis sensor kinase CheA
VSESRDPLKYFRVEARELLEELGRGALLLERGPEPSLVPRLLRAAHTLKGAARVVKQRAIAEHAHVIEDCLASLRAADGVPPHDAAQRLIAAIDALASEVRALDPESAEQAPNAAEPVRTVRVDVDEVDAIIEGLSEAGIQLQALTRSVTGLSSARRLVEALSDELGSTTGGDVTVPARSRVLVDDLHEVITRLERELEGSLDSVGRELLEARTGVERLRLLPIRTMFGMLERAARDAAQATARSVAFVTRGEDVRLDATVLFSVQNALVQLIRNAVAHGIETPSERVLVGKPRAGRLELTAIRRGSHVVFVCEDDGRGFDLAAVRARAVERGLASEAVEKMSEPELLELLFRGGLTTAATVTEVAGRGVGLNLVRDAADTAGGDVHVESRPGRGSRVELVVPVTHAALDALLVDAGGFRVAIPVEAVRRTLRADDTSVNQTSRGDRVQADGRWVPAIKLARALGEGAVPPRRGPSPMVLIEAAGDTIAVVVDRIVGIANVVVRPLPKVARASQFVTGATFDAQGNPQLVLDPASLVAAGARGESPLPVAEPARTLTVLVIDDSLTTRRLEQSILEAAGYEVDLATCAEEGLSQAQSKRYGLFLVDVEMPGMTGFEFIERVKADPSLRDIPAILVTSRNSPEDHRRAREVGASGFIVKGEFDQTELLELIRRTRS